MNSKPTSNPTGKKLLFVYGTLKQGFCRGNVLAQQKFLGQATTKPIYTMFDVNRSYPALVSTGATSIQGELYEIDAKLIPVLDRIEGAPWLYRLEPIQLESHPDLQCESYFFQQETHGLVECGSVWT
jgi:gamma-glutamylcyclotransferase (GGCT)/AIG2-like uncharacterized protein YtfP